MNPVVHFEMPAKDKKRVQEFYSKVFGWQMMQMGEEMAHYVLATTTPTDQPGGRPTEPGAINGGFFDYKDDELNRVPHLVISVDNLEESIEAVNNSGGQTIDEPMDIPNIGRYVSIKDTEGNIIGILQPLRM